MCRALPCGSSNLGLCSQWSRALKTAAAHVRAAATGYVSGTRVACQQQENYSRRSLTVCTLCSGRFSWQFSVVMRHARVSAVTALLNMLLCYPPVHGLLRWPCSCVVQPDQPWNTDARHSIGLLTKRGYDINNVVLLLRRL